MAHPKKTITVEDLLAQLAGKQLQFPPLTVSVIQVHPRQTGAGSRENLPDALVKLRWGEREYPFAVECRRLWTPKVIAEAAASVRGKSCPPQLYPLILVPYLPSERLAELEQQGISGLDLCGNGVVVVPSELLVYRTGWPNRFPREGAIKNVYRRNSSICARVFLLQPEFASVNDALQAIRARRGQVTLATLSKVCKNLEADLVIERSRRPAAAAPPPLARSPDRLPQPPRVKPSPLVRRLRLVQPEKLLDLLAANYAAPEIRRTFTGKSMVAPEELRQLLNAYQAAGSGARVVRTGASSVDAYAVMAQESVQSFYCSDLEGVLLPLGDRVREGPRFADVRFLETRDDFVYFDPRPSLAASPVQTYLELMAGDKRERETAEQVRAVLLAPFGK